jgi:hypothetical protein
MLKDQIKFCSCTIYPENIRSHTHTHEALSLTPLLLATQTKSIYEKHPEEDIDKVI